MNPIKKIVEILDENDYAFFKRYVAGYFFLVLLISIFIQVFFIWQSSLVKDDFKKINEKTKNVITLITKKIEMVGLKNAVEIVLKKEDHFRLKDYVYSVLQKNNFIRYLTSQNEVITEQKLKKDYVEYTMQIECSNLSTQEMLSILALLENDVRVYFKTIFIKNLQNKKIALQCAISTIKLI
jgi:hypothetical protein